jgi:hypothetical protein
MTAALSDVTILERGGRRPRRLTLSGLRCSWEVNVAGQLSGQAVADELFAAGFATTDLRGHWIAYEHPSAGRWGGVVSVCAPRNGLVEIGAHGFEVLLRKRLVTEAGGRNRPLAAPPGALLWKAIKLADRHGPTYVRRGRIDEHGSPVQAVWQAADVYEDVIPELTDALDREWEVEPDTRKVNYAKRLGRDRSGSVKLVLGREISDPAYEWVEDHWATVNVLHGTAELVLNARGAPRSRPFPIAATEVNHASVRRWGAMEAAVDLGRVGSRDALRDRLKRELNRLADPPAAVRLTTVDEGGVWSRFREGDDVAVELGDAGIRGTVRVRIRALDVEAGTLEIAGDGTRLAAPTPGGNGGNGNGNGGNGESLVVDGDGDQVVDSGGNDVVAG